MTGTLLVTQGQVGEALLDNAKSILGNITAPIATLSVKRTRKTQRIIAKAHQLLKKVDDGDGVLVLTDLYGATPHNLCKQFVDGHQVCTVSGLNISMLLRTLNYAHCSLKELANKAEQGGHTGIACQAGLA